jgi:hypothetical protein
MTRVTPLLLSLLLPGVAGCSLHARAPDEGSVLLGVREVSMYDEHQSIAVAIQDQPIHQLHVEVSGRPLQIYDVRVTFDDGRQVAIGTQLDFVPTPSHRIELPGPPATVRRVDLWYRSDAPPETYATIRLFGS